MVDLRFIFCWVARGHVSKNQRFDVNYVGHSQRCGKPYTQIPRGGLSSGSVLGLMTVTSLTNHTGCLILRNQRETAMHV